MNAGDAAAVTAAATAYPAATLCLCPIPFWEQRMVFKRFVNEGVNRARIVTHQTIGPTISLARALHASGKAITLTGMLGGDRGESIRAELTALGIAHEFLDIPQPTPACVCVIDECTGTQTRFFDPQPSIDRAAHQRLFEHVKTLLGSGHFAQLALPADLSDHYQPMAKQLRIILMTDAAA